MIPKEYQGKWQVECQGNRLAVNKVSGSFIFLIDSDIENVDSFNKEWFDRTPNIGGLSVKRDILYSMNWPAYLKSGEKEIVTFTESGDFYVED